VLGISLCSHIDAEHGNAEANADTRAFADTYNQSLKDDDQEFAYLEKGSELATPVADVYKSHDDEEEDDSEPQKCFSPGEVRRLLRERATEARLMSFYLAFSHCGLRWMSMAWTRTTYHGLINRRTYLV
jgi:hypothetical protein